MNSNYQIVLDNIIFENAKTNKIPKLLLHSCCAPCSSYVLEYLAKYFDITIYYYNPNIYPYSEYKKRLDEQIRLINDLSNINKIKILDSEYDYNYYLESIKGLENEQEGGNRCFKCYEIRMRDCAEKAIMMGFDYFGTTLSVSPYKNSKKLNEIGEKLEILLGVNFLYADFKKREGYKKSIELSHKYNLYRQEYCGCEFSIKEYERKLNMK